MSERQYDSELLKLYNYDEFSEEKYSPWMNWDKSPAIGQSAPDFPLWDSADQSETSLSAIWSANKFTVVEFGSFT